MKRAIILFLLAALLLTGCGEENTEQIQEPYTQVRDGVSYSIDPAAQTITANGYEFSYRYTEDGISVTYPNGAVYSRHRINEYASSAGWSNADTEFIISNGSEYADGDALLDVVPERTQEKKSKTISGENVLTILAGIAFIGVGAWMISDPHTHWHWNHGWMYKDAEPSDLALGVTGVAGILEIILGVVMIVIGIFM